MGGATPSKTDRRSSVPPRRFSTGFYNWCPGAPGLRDLEQVESYRRVDQDWPSFAKKLRRLIRDAIRLWKRQDIEAAEFASRRARVEVRLDELIEMDWQHKDARRLVKRLRRHREALFTFLDEAGVPFDNNHAERAIRPAVIIRKNSFHNRSQRGADAQAVLMSVYRTLKQRGHHPIQTITQAIEDYLYQRPALQMAKMLQVLEFFSVAL